LWVIHLLWGALAALAAAGGGWTAGLSILTTLALAAFMGAVGVLASVLVQMLRDDRSG
jgi:NADH:ubiquinone oxidoreductase subunit 6 (subunit J)